MYPKPEAVKITDASAQTVLAVDPAHDKLPDNLSADDMRVVTLWSLTPERISPDRTPENVASYKAPVQTSSYDVANRIKPAKYIKPSAAPMVAAATAPRSPTVSESRTASQAAPPATGRQRLPETASNIPLLALCGFACLIGGFALRITRPRTA